MVGLHGNWPDALHVALDDRQAPHAEIEVTLAWLTRFMGQDAVPPAPTFIPRLNPAAAARARAERIARETEVLRRALGALKDSAGRKPATPAEFAAQLKTATGEIEIHLEGEAVTLPPDAKAAAQSLFQDLGELPPEALSPAGDGP